MRTIDEVIAGLPMDRTKRLLEPLYCPMDGDGPEPNRLMLAVESMRRHMTDEGWQIADGLRQAGYKLAGKDLPIDETDVTKILTMAQWPDTIVIQDKREWEGLTADRSQDPTMRFEHVDMLATVDDIFKMTILKDAQSRQDYHRQSAEEMQVHGWIVYYHPRIVCHLANYIRPEHVVRTFHSVDVEALPKWSDHHKPRHGCLLSGAVSGAYPLRSRLVREHGHLLDTTYLPHPGYHRAGCQTPEFLRLLGSFKVAICTSSIYGYALRKIIEATVCGCMVITDLPVDEVLPEIDCNLIRVHPTVTIREMNAILGQAYARYDLRAQIEIAKKAAEFYDHRAVGRRLRDDIEALRKRY